MDLHRHPDLADRLACAYALGTLRGGARRRFEALARQHLTLRTAALLWQERFASLTELQPHEAPGPNVWKRIENLIAAEQRPDAAKEEPMLDRLRRHLGWWRGAALAGGVAAAAVAVVSVNLGRTVQAREGELARAGEQARQLAQQNTQLSAQLQARPDIQYVAVLSDEKSTASVLVTFDPQRNTLTLKRVGNFQEGPDRSLELWALPPGGAPRSLGVLGAAPVIRLTAAENQVREVPALAISLEPRGGAPAGKPTGPVLFKGALLQTAV
ncbi:MAG TPA: anti-sigma factor [Ramlibacter sp.]|jgi:anti-sigma-K factor RskA|uniref:anti-sigma factor n=1 Tax=Ramlibacter sp. TaxID=1917967 RepID=UPI002D631412|nr:anti-sigma factor [Ramlibacter sp.]HZY19093.1 anti-sigma factor [Ramlibacter sp.]